MEPMIIPGRAKDLGGFQVRRVLPFVRKRAVGPFVFFDEMGPARFDEGEGMNVRPHPHIGLATITYLFEGRLLHRDSLGVVETIAPGAVNLMTAGKGIVHSERCGAEECPNGSRMHGVQAWIALPAADEEIEPAFDHYEADAIPQIALPNATVRVVMGGFRGETSPVRTYSNTLYLDIRLTAGARVSIPADWEERAVYGVEGTVAVGGKPVDAGEMYVAEKDKSVEIAAGGEGRVIVIGGAALPEERHIWWNFVSSRPERVEQAKADWAASAAAGFKDAVFSLPPEESEHIPLPETPGVEPTRREPTS